MNDKDLFFFLPSSSLLSQHRLCEGRERLSCQRRSFVRLRRWSSTLDHCQSWPRLWRTTARSWSAVATTGSCSAGSRPLTVTATWCWRMSRRCGLSCLREPRERARSPLTRTASSARCSSEETPWSSCSETRLERQLWTWMEMSKIKRQVVCSFLFFFFLFFFLFFFSIYLSECSLHWDSASCACSLSSFAWDAFFLWKIMNIMSWKGGQIRHYCEKTRAKNEDARPDQWKV